MDRGELHAAATLFREAADYCRRHELDYEAFYRMRAGEAHVRAAERSLALGHAVELAENALMAAVDAFNELGAYSRVRETYRRLAQLPLSDKRSARYARLEARLGAVQDMGAEIRAVPEHLKAEMPYPEIWIHDVIEWELAGDAGETMAN